MRVIAGSAKRLRLKTVEGMGTRPDDRPDQKRRCLI